MYRIETHMHTKETSGCAKSTACEMVNKYKQLGYDGVIITDHFLNGNTVVDRSQAWEKQIEDFCKGYKSAKNEGDRIGMDVYFGFEYTFYGTDLLTYGISAEWLKEHPEIMDMPAYEYIQFIKENGGMVIQAHPFRDYDYINTIRLFPKYIDGIEAVNTAHRDKRLNELAKYISEFYDLPMTSGSDSHSVDGIGGGGMEFEVKIKSIEDFIRLVKLKKGKLLG